MKAKCIAAVMIHVPDWKEGLAWYQKAFPEAKKFSLPEFEGLELNGIKIEVVNADEKVGVGTYGIAVDWEVESFEEAFKHLTPVRRNQIMVSEYRIGKLRPLLQCSSQASHSCFLMPF